MIHDAAVLALARGPESCRPIGFDLAKLPFYSVTVQELETRKPLDGQVSFVRDQPHFVLRFTTQLYQIELDCKY